MQYDINASYQKEATAHFGRTTSILSLLYNDPSRFASLSTCARSGELAITQLILMASSN